MMGGFMSPLARKTALTAHVTFSVGWFGAVLAYLPLVIVQWRTADAGAARSALLAMDLIAWRVILPCSFLALITGLVMGFGTPWGLFRYFWVTAKLALTLVATAVLVGHLQSLSRIVALAATSAIAPQERLHLLVHALGGGLILLVTIGLSVFKPWGRTAYGERMARGGRADAREEVTAPDVRRYAVIAIAVLVVILAVVTHLARSGRFSH
jgi:hypothetical protein